MALPSMAPTGSRRWPVTRTPPSSPLIKQTGSARLKPGRAKTGRARLRFCRSSLYVAAESGTVTMLTHTVMG